MAGAVALGCFAAGGAVLFGELAGALVLVIATAAWAVIAVGAYLLFWRPR